MKAYGSAALTLLLLFLFTGCAKTAGFRGEPHLDESGKEQHPVLVTNEEFKEGGIALTGFVVRDGVKIHRTEDLPPEDAPFDHVIQNEFFGWQFERFYREKIAEPELVPFWVFDDFVSDDLMARIWTEFSEEGILDPETLEEIRATRPNVRFIAMARVVGDELSYNVMVPGMSSTLNSGIKGGAEGLTRVHGPTEGTPGVTRQRLINFQLSLFDLDMARMIWVGYANVELHEDSDRAALDGYGGLQARKGEDGEYTIEEVEDLTGAPLFTDAFELGVKELIKMMEKAAGGLPNPPSQPRDREPEVGEEEDMF